MSKELDQFYADIIITAVEGGIGYWSRGYGYAWSDEKPEITSVTVVQTEEAAEALGVTEMQWGYEWLDSNVDDERLAEFKHYVDVPAIRKAVYKLRGKAEVKYVSDEWRTRLRQAYTERDAGYLDAGDADIIFQYAALGEVVYG